MISFPGKALWDRLEKAEAERDALRAEVTRLTASGRRNPTSACRHSQRQFVFADEEIRCVLCGATAPLTVKQLCEAPRVPGTTAPDLSEILEWSDP